MGNVPAVHGAAVPALTAVLEPQAKPRPVPPAVTVSRLVLRYCVQSRDSGRMGDRTIANVRHVLGGFAAVAPTDPRKVQRRHVERWMARPNLAASTRRAHFSMLRNFLDWSVMHRHMTVNPMAGMRAPRKVKGVPKRLRRDEALELVRTAAEHGTRTLIVVLLMLQEGLRGIEVSRMLIEDIDFGEQTLLVRGKGAGGEADAALPISDETWTVLVAYLAEYRLSNGPLIQNRWKPGAPVSRGRLGDLVTAAMFEAGIKREGDLTRTPHSLRHTCAHDLLSRTKNVRAVQQALRHDSVASTEIYLRGHVANLRETMTGRTYLAAGAPIDVPTRTSCRTCGQPITPGPGPLDTYCAACVRLALSLADAE